jgi:hypothetical protein
MGIYLIKEAWRQPEGGGGYWRHKKGIFNEMLVNHQHIV